MSEAECIFCKVIARNVDASIVYQDDRVTAFMDIRPLTEGHLLVVPNQHSRDLEGVAAETAGWMTEIGRKLGLAMLESDLGCKAFNLFLANGAEAGQTVFHSHMHVIPRYPNDGFGVRFPPGFGRMASREKLDRQAESIRICLQD